MNGSKADRHRPGPRHSRERARRAVSRVGLAVIWLACGTAAVALPGWVYNRPDFPREVYLQGMRDGITVGHDLLLNQRPGDKILAALAELLSMEDREFAEIALYRGEPILEGRYTGAANALISTYYGR